MDCKQLQTFVTVAKLLNFREAAEELNYAQSSVSDHIRNLEQELGVKLFERIGRKVYLNEYGEKLLTLAENMIGYEKKIYETFNENDKVSGLLRIGASETLSVFWLPRIFKEYHTRYPNVKVILKMADCMELPRLLENNTIDIAFSLHNESKRQDITQVDIFKDATVFITAPDHKLAALKTIEVQKLENQALILTESKSAYRIELEEYLRKYNVNVDVNMELSSLEALKQCVKSGLGISLVPQITVKKEIDSGELVQLSIKDFKISIFARMIYHKQKWISAQMNALMNMILSKEGHYYNI